MSTVLPSDEARHPIGSDLLWSERYYLDFVDEAQGVAGYVRLGLCTGWGRAWCWACRVGPGHAPVGPAQLLRQHPDVRAALQKKFRWLLVDELNRRNITTELSGDHYNNRVVMVHFPRRYQRWLRKAHLPAGWAIIYGSPASLDDYLVGQIKEHPRHRRFAYTCLIKKTAQIITGKEAAEVASAIDTALPASIKSPGGSQPAYKQGRFYYAVNWYDNKAPLAFRKRSARDLWVAINARCKALSVKDLMGEPYGLKRKNIPDKLTKVTWWQAVSYTHLTLPTIYSV